MICNAVEIEVVALTHGYRLEQKQENIGLMIFVKQDSKHGSVQVNVYTTRMTVGTSLNHPKSGKTQLFRRHVSMQELAAIFKNPRVHLGTGYRQRGQ